MKLSKPMIDSAWNSLDYGSTLFAFLITTKLIIDAIGVEGYGFYTLFMSFIYTLALADLGVGMAISKYLSEYLNNDSSDLSNEVITFGLIFYSVVGLLLFSITVVLSPYIVQILSIAESYGSIAPSTLLICSGIVLLNLNGSIFLGVLIARERWRIISLTNITVRFFAIVGVFVIVNSSFPPTGKVVGLFIVTLLASLIKLMVLFIVSKSLVPALAPRIPSVDIRSRVFHYLRHTTVQYGLSSLVGHFDKILISRFYGLETTAYYGFVVNVFVYMYGFLVNILKIYFPKLSRLHGSGQMGLVGKLFKKIIVISATLSFTLAMIVAMSWVPIMSIYVDEQFARNSFAILLAFLFYLVIRSSEPVFSLIFTAIAKPQVLVKNVLIGAPVTVVSYFIFVPLFGVVGFVVAQITGAVAVIVYNSRQVGFLLFESS
jgi:O-antigen/teichoic acid export membrane protein